MPQPAGFSHDTRFFGHPLGLSTLFFTELWERFGYYGMRALLVLFMIAAPASGGFGFDDSTAYAIYGLYTASVYGWSLPGGWLADRFLGQRRAVLIGGILITLGYLMMAIPAKPTFFCGLVVVVLGTGLLKPNVSTIVGQLYSQDDPRRDSAFSIFYMGINIGAFVAPLVCGYAGQQIDWRLGFGLAGAGMGVGLLWFIFGQRPLGDAGLHPVTPANPREAAAQRRLLRNGAAALVLVLGGVGSLALTGKVTAQTLNNAAGVFLLTVTAVLFGWMLFGGEWSPGERRRLTVIFVLFTASALFYSAFEQAGSSLNVFAERHTSNSLFGISYPASWYQSLNSLFVVTLAPVFAWLWNRLGKRNPSSPAKFSMALFSVGISFLLMMTAAGLASSGMRVGAIWLEVAYLLHTIGEMCLYPVGLSAFTKLAPARVAGLMMGVLFLSISTGNYVGGKLASLYGDLPMHDLFRTVAIFALAAGVGMMLLTGRVSRMERDVQ